MSTPGDGVPPHVVAKVATETLSFVKLSDPVALDAIISSKPNDVVSTTTTTNTMSVPSSARKIQNPAIPDEDFDMYEYMPETIMDKKLSVDEYKAAKSASILPATMTMEQQSNYAQSVLVPESDLPYTPFNYYINKGGEVTDYEKRWLQQFVYATQNLDPKSLSESNYISSTIYRRRKAGENHQTILPPMTLYQGESTAQYEYAFSQYLVLVGDKNLDASGTRNRRFSYDKLRRQGKLYKHLCNQLLIKVGAKPNSQQTFDSSVPAAKRARNVQPQGHHSRGFQSVPRSHAPGQNQANERASRRALYGIVEPISSQPANVGDHHGQQEEEVLVHKQPYRVRENKPASNDLESRVYDLETQNFLLKDQLASLQLSVAALQRVSREGDFVVDLKSNAFLKNEFHYFDEAVHQIQGRISSLEGNGDPFSSFRDDLNNQSPRGDKP